MIIISQNNNTMLLSQHITGGDIVPHDSYYDHNEGYDILMFSLSGDLPNMGTYSTKEQAQQELKRILERISNQSSNASRLLTYQLPPAGYNGTPNSQTFI